MLNERDQWLFEAAQNLISSDEPKFLALWLNSNKSQIF